MNARLGISHFFLATGLLAALACGGRRPPPYDVAPVLANREEVKAALRAVGGGLEARVVLQMRVDEEGRPQDVSVKRESGAPDLDDAALWVGEMMRFEPARYQGQPVSAWVEVPVTFDVVSRVISPPRLRNAEVIGAEIARDYPDLRGIARFRVQVDGVGWVSGVRDRRRSDPDVRKVARPLVDRLLFVPAFRGGEDIAAWVNIVFEFAGRNSRVYIESPKT